MNTLVCQKRGNTTIGHKMLLQADMNVLKEKRILLSGGKTKDYLVAYYTNTDKSQLNRNIQSSSVVYRRTEPLKRPKMSIWTSQSYERKRTQGRIGGEFNVRLGSLISGANLTEFQCEKTLVNHKYFMSHLR